MDWARKDGEVTISQRTVFPESTTVELTVSVSRPARFGIKVRVPGWLAGSMRAWVDGEETPAAGDSRHWATFRREWKNGDKLKIELPMKLWVSRIDPTTAFPAAIMCGPVALAVRSLGRNPSAEIDFSRIESALVPSPGKPLTWHLASDRSVLVKPFYAFKEGEQYLLYLDPAEHVKRTPQ